MSRRIKLGRTGALAFLLAAAPSEAQELELPRDAPTSKTHEYSSYEQEAINNELQRLSLEPELHAEGKLVERVEIVPLEVIEKRDPAPGFLNVFHATSRKEVIAREVLLLRGQPYRKVLADESARNLRKLPQLSVVVVMAARGSTPDRVVLVVITKDIWSLRLNTGVQYSSGGLERLALQPSEINLFGLHHVAGILYEMDPAAMTFGASYSIPRLSFSRSRTAPFSALLLDVNASVIVNRTSGDTEGSYGGVTLARPLRTTLSSWSWTTSTQWLHQVSRRFTDAELATYDAEATPEQDAIPYSYRARRFVHESSVTRSFGWAKKNDFALGVQYNVRDYSIRAAEQYNPLAVAEFQQKRVPTDDRRLSPFVQYRGYTTDFLRVLDLETLALQEDYSLGHSVILRLYPAFSDLLSSRTFMGVFAAAQYTVELLDGFARVGVESQTESEPERLADGSIKGFWRVVTPRLGFGRLISDTLFLYRYRNFLNRQLYLGGDGRLRGYPSSYDVGESVVSHNQEFRTPPLELFSLQLGGALFYDVGDAFDHAAEMRLKHSVGFGFRALFPQLDKVVLRGDVGFPLTAGRLPADVSPWSFYVAFEQAMDVPSIALPKP